MIACSEEMLDMELKNIDISPRNCIAYVGIVFRWRRSQPTNIKHKKVNF